MSDAPIDPYRPPGSTQDVDPRLPPTELASVGRRYVGSAIDGVLGGLVSMPFLVATGVLDRMAEQEMSPADGALVIGATLASFLLLHGYTLHTRGQTLAKMFLKIRIVSAADQKLVPLWKIVVLRYVPVTVAASIPVLGVLIAVADALFIFRSDSRCLHDHLAGTIVVNTQTTVDPWSQLKS